MLIVAVAGQVYILNMLGQQQILPLERALRCGQLAFSPRHLQITGYRFLKRSEPLLP